MGKLLGMRIKNYGALKDIKMGQTYADNEGKPLDNMVAIIGPSGNGKSSLADAFGFISDCLNSDVETACNANKPSYIGTLAEGLREDSRIKLKPAGLTITIDQMVAAYAADKIANIVWMLSDDGQKGLNQPKSMLAVLTGKAQAENSNIISYDSPEEFEEAMRKYER